MESYFQDTSVKKLKPIEFLERGEQKSLSAEAWIAHLSVDIARRELTTASAMMGWGQDNLSIY